METGARNSDGQHMDGSKLRRGLHCYSNMFFIQNIGPEAYKATMGYIQFTMEVATICSFKQDHANMYMGFGFTEVATFAERQDQNSILAHQTSHHQKISNHTSVGTVGFDPLP